MIDKETWKIGTDHDKMEKLIKYHLHVQYHKNHLLEKEKTFPCNHKTIHSFCSMNDSFHYTPRPNWENKMDWENDV